LGGCFYECNTQEKEDEEFLFFHGSRKYNRILFLPKYSELTSLDISLKDSIYPSKKLTIDKCTIDNNFTFAKNLTVLLRYLVNCLLPIVNYLFSISHFKLQSFHRSRQIHHRCIPVNSNLVGCIRACIVGLRFIRDGGRVSAFILHPGIGSTRQ
jgi:hypothetical protein